MVVINENDLLCNVCFEPIHNKDIYYKIIDATKILKIFPYMCMTEPINLCQQCMREIRRNKK